MTPMVLVERRLLEKATETLRSTPVDPKMLANVLAEIDSVLGRDSARRQAAKDDGSDWKTLMK